MIPLRRISLPSIIVIALLATSCRSNRIPSDYSSSEFTTRKSEVVFLLAQAEERMPDVKTYEVKNAKTKVDYKGNSANIKANISFTRGALTTFSGRIQFPPVSVGKVEINGDKASLKSNLLGIDKEFTIPSYFGDAIQCAFLGIVPPVYNLFGEQDFSHFSMRLSSDGKYVLYRSDSNMDIYLYVNAIDFSFSGLHYEAAGSNADIIVSDYQSFDGRSLPTQVEVVAKQADGSNGSMSMTISNPKINK